MLDMLICASSNNYRIDRFALGSLILVKSSLHSDPKRTWQNSYCSDVVGVGMQNDLPDKIAGCCVRSKR
jgi:hypothetical protein